MAFYEPYKIKKGTSKMFADVELNRVLMDLADANRRLRIAKESLREHLKQSAEKQDADTVQYLMDSYADVSKETEEELAKVNSFFEIRGIAMDNLLGGDRDVIFSETMVVKDTSYPEEVVYVLSKGEVFLQKNGTIDKQSVPNEIERQVLMEVTAYTCERLRDGDQVSYYDYAVSTILGFLYQDPYPFKRGGIH